MSQDPKIIQFNLKIINRCRMQQKISQIIYFIIKQLRLPMASLHSRNSYSPYSKGSMQENEQLPLRSKAFSQIDNTIQSYSQSQYTNSSANQDKISQIKKKYEKLLSKSNNKSNQENSLNIIPSHQFGKSVSTFDAQDQNSRWSPYNKSYQTPTTNKDRRIIDPNEGLDTKNAALRQYVQRDYNNVSKVEVKSQLQCNRMTLNAMKNELQSKLSDLSAKTSGLRNPSNPPKQPEKKQDASYGSYQAILNKYSKNISQNRTKNTNEVSEKTYPKYKERYVEPPNNQKVETLQTKIKETAVSSYISKYSNTRNNVATIQKIVKQKQLSTISEVSNSNHSQNPSFQAEAKDYKEKTFERYKRVDNMVKQNAQSNIIIERPVTFQNRSETNNWFKNTTSYVDSKADTECKKEQSQKNMEFTLQKLQNSEGFSITRTVTEENFMNLNKLNQLQARFDHRQRSITAPRSENQSQAFKKQTAQPVQIKCKQQNQKPSEEKSQIQKLKEKYGFSATTASKYSNPYRERKPQTLISAKDPKYTREISAIKQPKDSATQKQVKVEPRNNEVISKEIEKLDMKIKLIQQNKKDLNINFRPYEISKSVPKVPQNHQVQTPTSIYAEQIEKSCNIATNISIQTASNDKNKYNLRYQAYLQRVKPLYSQITLSEPQKSQSNGFSIKLHPVQYNNDQDAVSERSISQVGSKSRVNEYKNKVELGNRTDNGIQERKKKLQDKVETNNNIKSLVRAFGQQAVYDEVFRNNKIWFSGQRGHKWGDLKKQLASLSISLTQSELKEVFTLQQSENNPFFSVSDNKCNMRTLAQSYKQAQRHWQQKIVGKFYRSQLEKEGFTSYRIDCDKKGYIQIEDLVRFLNIESGSFLRNRDVSIIFRRMTNIGNKLQFNQLLSAISG